MVTYVCLHMLHMYGYIVYVCVAIHPEYFVFNKIFCKNRGFVYIP